MKDAKRFRKGDRVHHHLFGHGRVRSTRVEGIWYQYIWIQFDTPSNGDGMKFAAEELFRVKKGGK
jgi:hypothetical protein